MCVVMDVNETKKCRIVPKKNRFVPDLLINNQRIEEEITLDINKAEIARAMSLADVYMIGEDGETLLTPENFYIKEEKKNDDTGVDEDGGAGQTQPQQPGSTESETNTNTETDGTSGRETEPKSDTPTITD